MDPTDFVAKIAAEQKLALSRVQAAVSLLAEGATIPFIARYRKEATGSLDEVALRSIRDRLHRLEELRDRQAAVLGSLDKTGHLTPELRKKVLNAETMTALEDIYLPYKPKRRTRAVLAREKGLEPLAMKVFKQDGTDPTDAAEAFTDAEKEVDSVEAALAGARDIIAEIVNENDGARAALRNLFFTKAVVKTGVAAGMEEKGVKFKDYFDWQEPIDRIPSHRMLAVFRGERENALNLDIRPDETEALRILEDLFVTGEGADSEQVRMAVRDGYKRLLSRSMETEARVFAKERADGEAIPIFSENLRQLLMAPPLGAKRVMGMDPGFRTGCKLVCLDRQGKLLHHDTVFPHRSDRERANAAQSVKHLCEQFDIEAVAVGNGTAGRETESFVRGIPFAKPVVVVMVSESGASIYSASEAARQEFPDHDLTVRGAVSIGRRLMDPLAELVKIDPKSIGVGQYQHDVDPSLMKQALDDVVVSCVNAVGVDVNRASTQLLTYVSGLNAGIARNIVSHREENGPFKNKKQLRQVPRLGPKAFEQSAGFLRIPDAENPLDASAVHPESYPIVDAMAKDLNASVVDLIQYSEMRDRIDISKYVTEAAGIPTLKDILAELAKPGRDPRKSFEAFSFAQGIEKIENLRPGMKLPGIVTNITGFGAFVDIGVHQDGLVHISQMADRFVKNPADIVKLQQQVEVTVLEVDLARKRISLSMKTSEPSPEQKGPAKVQQQINRRRAVAPNKNPGKSRATLENPLAEALIKGGFR